MLAPDSGKLPRIPRLTGRDDVTDKIKALKPDLILDYGKVIAALCQLAQATQQKTGVPTILLAGPLANIPHVVREAWEHPASGGARRNGGELRRGDAGAAGEPLAVVPPRVALCARRGRPDGRRPRYRRDRGVQPPWLAGRRARRSGDVPHVKHRSDRRARSGYPDFLRPGDAGDRSRIPTPGNRCGRCGKAMPWSRPACHSAGSKNLPRSIACSVSPG